MTLDQLLGPCYAASAMGKGDPETAKAGLISALQADPELANEARTRLSGLTDSVVQRCVISRTHREYLTAALAAL